MTPKRICSLARALCRLCPSLRSQALTSTPPPRACACVWSLLALGFTASPQTASCPCPPPAWSGSSEGQVSCPADVVLQAPGCHPRRGSTVQACPVTSSELPLTILKYSTEPRPTHRWMSARPSGCSAPSPVSRGLLLLRKQGGSACECSPCRKQRAQDTYIHVCERSTRSGLQQATAPLGLACGVALIHVEMRGFQSGRCESWESGPISDPSGPGFDSPTAPGLRHVLCFLPFLSAIDRRVWAARSTRAKPSRFSRIQRLPFRQWKAYITLGSR